MAGASFDVTFDGTDATRRLAQLARATDDLRPYFRDLGEYLQRSHDDRWSQEEAPDGTPWAPLKPKTAARKAPTQPNAGLRTLDEHLRRLTVQSDRTSVEIGTNRIYGATHQFGDPKRGIPARPYLGLSDAERDEIGDLAADYLDRALR